MAEYGNIKWQPILKDVAEKISTTYSVELILDEAIVLEAEQRIKESLDNLGFDRPNVAKVAGQVAFWLRKLKPLSIAPSSKNYFRLVNELAALRIGLAICNCYKDDCSKDKEVQLHSRILRDWVTSFRYHSHSPHSSMTSFELLMCDN
ncbi:hypothetical protein [Desulfovibrio sp. ZJ369]|uniref:hypothetical protein n=1 Tax=Desulfovibrio sp. ZJ369 TaxID=2709793 RepID=UPI0013EB6B11|nr:hypothetical protein [Desulfovibrio sp. ZJ369]